MAEANVITPKEASEGTVPEATRGGIYYTLCIDIYETAEEVVVLCDMPGIKPQDLDVQFENGELSLHGTAPQRQISAGCLEEEYDMGNFYRSMTIGSEVDSAKISTQCRDGVLTIHLPRVKK